MTANSNEALIAFASTLSVAQQHLLSWVENISGRTVRLWPGFNATAHQISDRGRATHTHNSYKVKPTLSDLVCDVEIAARHALTQAERTHFKAVYLTMGLSADSPRGDDAMRTKLGAAFIERGLFPLPLYLNHAGEDVRARYAAA